MQGPVETREAENMSDPQDPLELKFLAVVNLHIGARNETWLLFK